MFDAHFQYSFHIMVLKNVLPFPPEFDGLSIFQHLKLNFWFI